MMRILITGAAGFIGSRLMAVLAQRGYDVLGLDELNGYTDLRLKYGRLKECGFIREDFQWGEVCKSSKYEECKFVRMSIDNKESLDALFEKYSFDAVVNLAAQAGVRYSVENPYAFMRCNVMGFFNVLEACRIHGIGHFVFASSSSVYGIRDNAPYHETDMTDTPESLYAATKKSNEIMAYSYARLYGIPTTGLRFFTVYGPWGRPDMAPMLFADAIVKGHPVKLYNNGEMIRDFTYIDDVVDGIVQVLQKKPVGSGNVPFRVYNLGCSKPVNLLDFLAQLEESLGRKALREYMPMQQGDVYQTHADMSRFEEEIGFRPSVSMKEGVKRFVAWFESAENPLKNSL